MASQTTPPIPRTITQKSWCVVRASPDGPDWISDVEPAEDLARRMTTENDRAYPAWAKLHPVVAVRPCTITVEL